MLLDRLFSLLSPEEITAVLRGFGWTIQDYQRGYILKVGSIDTVVEPRTFTTSLFEHSANFKQITKCCTEQNLRRQRSNCKMSLIHL